MAFKDFPQVDQSSINSDRSERALEGLLSQANGFICRPEKPDKGCDYDVELIIGRTNAYNWRFGVQLKSVGKIPLIDDGKIISYPFKTSRLNYLLNRPIGDGLIVIFDDDTGNSYFEYAQQVYQRLMELNGSEEWFENEMVSIHIPVANLLDDAGIEGIHQWFADKFDKAAFILQSQGARYNYPVIPGNEPAVDINNPDSIKEFLLNYGFSQMRAHDIFLLYEMITAIPAATLDQHPTLMVMAAIIHGEVGARYESQHIIQKLKRRSAIPEDQVHLVRLTELKNQLVLGDIEIPAFVESMKVLRQQVKSERNEVVLDLNIIFYELQVPKFYHQLPSGIHERIRAAFEKIQALEVEVQGKQLLEVWNTENLASLIAYYRLKQLNQKAIQRSMGVRNRSAELARESNLLANLQEELYRELERLFQVGEETGDELLQAYTILVRSRYVLTQEMDVISQMPILADIKFHKEEMFINTILLSLQAADIFRDFNYREAAHQCLCYGIELITVSREIHKYKDDFDLDHLHSVRVEMEKSWELQPWHFVVPDLIARIETETKENTERPMFVTKNLDDEQLLNMAKGFCQAMNLPHKSLGFVVEELKGYRTFYQRNTEGYEIIAAPRHPVFEVAYGQPVKFIIRNKATGITSLPVQNVDVQLKHWGL